MTEAVRVEADRHQTHLAAQVVRAGRAALVIWLGLIALAVARAAYAFDPSMWGWGFDLVRFVAPGPAWTLWALSAITLIPPVARWSIPP